MKEGGIKGVGECREGRVKGGGRVKGRGGE